MWTHPSSSLQTQLAIFRSGQTATKQEKGLCLLQAYDLASVHQAYLVSSAESTADWVTFDSWSAEKLHVWEWGNQGELGKCRCPSCLFVTWAFVCILRLQHMKVDWAMPFTKSGPGVKWTLLSWWLLSLFWALIQPDVPKVNSLLNLSLNPYCDSSLCHLSIPFPASSSLALTSAHDNIDKVKGHHSSSSLVHCLMKLAQKEGGSHGNPAMLRAAFTVMSTLALSSECAGILWKVRTHA